MSAAIDVQRCGILRPLPAELLGRLYPRYLTARDERLDVRTVLDWAVEPEHELAGCVEKSGPDAYCVADYLLDRVQEQDGGAQVPEGVWTDLAAWAPAELRNLAASALRMGQAGVAERLLQSGQDDPRAVFDLALLLHGQGRVEEARKPYE